MQQNIYKRFRRSTLARVVLKNVYKCFPDPKHGKPVNAVKDFNLTCEDKEFIVLVGPSGCGKSTTLRLVAGLEELTEGEIYIDDKLVNDMPPKDRDIAMVFQNNALYPHMNAYENMAFGLKLKKIPINTIKERVAEAAEILDINQLLHKKPKELAGNERWRLALGRAIVRKPKVFLFDEPLSNLDDQLRVMMRAEISRIYTKLQATMIYVTHDQIEAMTMGDRIVVMKGGDIQQIADSMTLYDQPCNEFVAGFIGSPSINVMEGTVIRKEDTLHFFEGNFSVKIHDNHIPFMEELEGKEIKMGIRPEDIYDKVYASKASPDNTITATVEVVEPLGAEAHIYFTTGTNQFIARMDSYEQLGVNQDIDLVLDMSKVHYFNKKTEQTII